MAPATKPRSVALLPPATAGRNAEQRHLHRLSLDVGDRHHERTIVHGGEHEGGRGDLRQRSVDDPRQEA
jgi:hypothetical protein